MVGEGFAGDNVAPSGGGKGGAARGGLLQGSSGGGLRHGTNHVFARVQVL